MASAIRLARVLAALQGCAGEGREDDLILLLLEASQVASGHARADRFLYDHPDLAAISNDAEAVRRACAAKAGWPGGRHAALAVAHAFSTIWRKPSEIRGARLIGATGL
ncbi:hypothetical protein [Roseiarcus fermentans]|uniref:hypothetical protein n=1 Tax=Roseiarcus fermentans TaxID=1473586 RepID=UPI0011BDFF6E|nr:hypothetical protein [Roseiarcus fermentans]